MHAFICFLGLIAAALVAMAVFAYPAWLWLHPLFGFPFHRVADRIGMLTLAIGLLVIARRLQLGRKGFGYGAPPRLFGRELALGFTLGAPLMAAIVAVIVALGLREWKGQAPDAATLARVAAVGILRGLAVAFIEETFLRGAMFSAIARESGARTAILLTAVIYAVTHFVGQSHVPDAQVNWLSGLVMLGGALRAFAHPLSILDAFACLWAVGVVLGIVRALTGNIGACIGLHASWVWIITFVRETSVPNVASPLAFLVSRFDGLVGWLVFTWTALMAVALYAFYSRRSGTPDAATTDARVSPRGDG